VQTRRGAPTRAVSWLAVLGWQARCGPAPLHSHFSGNLAANSVLDYVLRQVRLKIDYRTEAPTLWQRQSAVGERRPPARTHPRTGARRSTACRALPANSTAHRAGAPLGAATVGRIDRLNGRMSRTTSRT